MPTEKMKEIELELTPNELRLFSDFCSRNNINFNDWIRALAHAALRKEKENHDA